MIKTRLLLKEILATLKRGKSVLLLGARQTGKTTLISHIPADLRLNLMQSATRRRYESDPSLLGKELRALQSTRKPPLIIIDEIQKAPALLDEIQVLIDEGLGQFVLTGSSARKLRRPPVNLLPGRIVSFHLYPLLLTEIEETDYHLDHFLLYGMLPGILSVHDPVHKEQDLKTYIDVYLEEEIRAEAIVRDMGIFSRFLELAAAESGQIINISKLSQEIGVAHKTLESYYQILEDCLIIERVQPLVHTKTRRRLIKSNRYLLFDLGIRRVAALEGIQPPQTYKGQLFEQWVGLQLIYFLREKVSSAQVKYWRDANGLEVDWVIEHQHQYLPIEVKLKETPTLNDVSAMKIFLKEYTCPQGGLVVCQTPRRFKITDHIIAIPWQDLLEFCLF